jgi:hypothetical protein
MLRIRSRTLRFNPPDFASIFFMVRVSTRVPSPSRLLSVIMNVGFYHRRIHPQLTYQQQCLCSSTSLLLRRKVAKLRQRAGHFERKIISKGVPVLVSPGFGEGGDVHPSLRFW